MKSSRPRASGLTLIEAVVGTALLGTLLASILIAGGRVRIQGARAERRVEACRIADDLLRQWWSDREEFPRGDRGDVVGRDGWTWRTRRVARDDAESLDAEVIALEIFGPDDRDRPAARVEVFLTLLTKERNEQGQGPDTD